MLNWLVALKILKVLVVFLWSIGKYTGDYGAIASAAPITLIGKILATVNGLLGIALFAIPTGLLGSAFIDQLSAQKHKLAVDKKIKTIENHFEQSIGGKSILVNRKANNRFLFSKPFNLVLCLLTLKF